MKERFIRNDFGLLSLSKPNVSSPNKIARNISLLRVLLFRHRTTLALEETFVNGNGWNLVPSIENWMSDLVLLKVQEVKLKILGRAKVC